MANRELYYDIYNEFYSVNKYRELKSIMHHGSNRLEHINRVSKMSFSISRKLHLDYVSCTRGALLHDFFTTDDLNKKNVKYTKFLKNHPSIALYNSKKYFELNNIEENIILTHMYPLCKEKPKYKEAKIVCLCDKLVSIYEFFRFKINLSLHVLVLLFIR